MKEQRQRSSVELLHVGAIALGDNSHLNYNIWAPCINSEEADTWYGRTTRMRITHCWDKDPEIAATSPVSTSATQWAGTTTWSARSTA